MTSEAASGQRSYCGHCGRALAPGASACGNCGADVYRDPQTAMPTAAMPGPAVAPTPVLGRPTVASEPPLRLGMGESIWRSYKVTQLRHASRGEGTLHVTNARVIFHGVARPRGMRRGSVVMQETRVEGITGLTVHRADRVNLLLFLALVFFGLGTLLLLRTGSASLAFVFLLVTAGIGWRIAVGGGRQGTTGLLIHSGSSNATPVSLGHFGEATGNHLLRSWIDAPARFLRELFGRYDALDLLIGFQGPDAEVMVAELGALIYDLQTRGDLARDTWELPAASS
jgi:hypothetical protein